MKIIKNNQAEIGGKVDLILVVPYCVRPILLYMLHDRRIQFR